MRPWNAHCNNSSYPIPHFPAYHERRVNRAGGQRQHLPSEQQPAVPTCARMISAMVDAVPPENSSKLVIDYCAIWRYHVALQSRVGGRLRNGLTTHLTLWSHPFQTLTDQGANAARRPGLHFVCLPTTDCTVVTPHLYSDRLSDRFPLPPAETRVSLLAPAHAPIWACQRSLLTD